MNATLKDSLVSFLRVWVLTTLGLFIPALLGWINELTQWANEAGTKPFPDVSGLGYLFVAAVAGAFPAALAAILRLVENKTGSSWLPRPSGPNDVPPTPGETGAASLVMVGLLTAVVGLLILVATTADLIGWVVIIVGLAIAAYSMITARRAGV